MGRRSSPAALRHARVDPPARWSRIRRADTVRRADAAPCQRAPRLHAVRVVRERGILPACGDAHLELRGCVRSMCTGRVIADRRTANCEGNPSFVPVAAGGDGVFVQYCERGSGSGELVC
jgi:hypothetical protein